MELLSDVMRERRKELNLTQEEVAARMGVKQAYISALENGKKINPSADTLMKIAEALNICFDELMVAIMPDEEKAEYIRKRNEEYQAANPELSVQENELLTGFRSLSSNRKLNAIEFIKSLQIMDDAEKQALIKKSEVS